MSNIGKDAADKSGESQIRGRELGGSDPAKRPKSDDAIRTDGEKDSLYDDGIEIGDDSDPLTAINGADDTQRKRG